MRLKQREKTLRPSVLQDVDAVNAAAVFVFLSLTPFDLITLIDFYKTCLKGKGEVEGGTGFDDAAGLRQEG